MTDSPAATGKTLDHAEILIGIGEGPIAGLDDGLKSFYFGDTPVMNADGSMAFDNCTIDVYPGDPNPDPIHMMLGGLSNSTTVGVNLYSGTPINRTTTSGNINALDIRILANNVQKTDGSGGTDVSFTIQYKRSSSPTWLDFGSSSNRTISGQFQNKVFEYRIPVDPVVGDTYDIRVTKTSAETDSKFYRDIQWESFQEITTDDLSFPNTAMVRVNTKVSNQFSSLPQMWGVYKGFICRVPTNFDPIAHTYTGVWDGTFKLAWTNDPVWLLYECIMNTTWGCNRYYACTIDKYDCYDVSKNWTSVLVPDGQGGYQPRYTFNRTITEPTDAIELLNIIAGSFNGRCFDDQNGTINLVVDKNDDAVKLFTPEMVENGMFTYSYTDLNQRYNRLTLKFPNPDLNWENDRRVIWNQDSIDAIGECPLDYQMDDCTDVHEALRRGYFRMESSITETEQVSFRTNRMGSTVQPFDVILIADPDMGYALSGRVKSMSIDRKTITFRETLPLEGGVSYTLNFQTPSGLITASYTPASSGSFNNLTFGTALDAAIGLNNAFSIGSGNGLAGLPKPYRILSIVETEGSADKIDIIAMEMNRNKYAAADNATFAEDINYSNRVVGVTVLPPSDFSYDVTSKTVAGDTQVILTLNWKDSDDTFFSRYRVEYEFNGKSAILLTETVNNTVPFVNPPEGDYKFYIYAVNTIGSVSSALVGVIPSGFSVNVAPPSPITGLEISGQGNNTTFTTQDVKVDWRISSQTPLDLDEAELLPAMADSTFDSFLIQFYDTTTGELFFEDTTVNPFYNLSYSRNYSSKNGPHRKITVSVRYRDTLGNITAPASLHITNPAPDVVRNITQKDGQGQTVLTWDKSPAPDLGGYFVWASTTGGFTPNSSNLIYDGQDNAVTYSTNVGVPVYFRVAAYDTFDKTTYTLSSQTMATIPGVDGGVIVAGTIGSTAFSSNLAVPSVLATLPATGTEGQLVINSSDGKIYRYHAGAWTVAQATADLVGQIVNAQIAAGAIAATNFATGIRPIQVVSTLPTTGNVLGDQAFLTTDKKLYRYDGSAWISLVAAGDISGQLINSQIAAGAISATNFATGIRPVQVVGTLPSTGNVLGDQAFLTTDKKLYRYDGSAWISTTAAADMTGQIGTAQIAPGAVDGTIISASAAFPSTATINGVTLGLVQDQAARATLNWVDIRAANGGSPRYTFSGDAVVVSDSLTSWAGNAYSQEFYVGSASMSFQISTNHAMVGLTTVRGYNGSLNNDYTYLSYAINWDGSHYNFYESGTGTAGPNGSPNDLIQITYDGLNVRYYQNGSPIRTVAAASGLIMYAGVAGYNNAMVVGHIKFGPFIDNSLSMTDPASRINAYSTTLSGTKITAGTVDATQLATNAVTAVKIAANAVTAAKTSIAAIDPSTGNLTANSVTATQIVAGSITSVQIAAGTIVASNIQAGAIGTTQLAANSITASKLYIGSTDNLVLDAKTIEASSWSLFGSPSGFGSYPVGGGAWINDYALTWTSTSTGVQGPYSKPAACQPGDTFYFSCYAQAGPTGSGPGSLRLYAAWFNSAGGNFQNNVLATTTSGGALSGTYQAPAGASYVGLMMLSDGASGVQYFAGAPVIRRMYTGQLIVNGSIVAANIQTGTITANEIAGGTITGSKIAAATIAGSNIIANTITATNLAVNSVTANAIAANAVTASKLYIGDAMNLILDPDCKDVSYWNNGGVGNQLGSGYNGGPPYWIADYLIYTTTISGNTAVIRSPFVTCKDTDQFYLSAQAYLSGGAGQATLYLICWNSAGGYLGAYGIGSVSGTGTPTAISGISAVPSGTRFVSYSLQHSVTNQPSYQMSLCAPVMRLMYTGQLIVNGSITAANIAANTITATQIQAGTITATELASNSVTTIKIAAGAVTATQIAANTITAGQIQAGAIGTTQLAANSITASKLYIGATDNLVLDAKTIDVGSWNLYGSPSNLNSYTVGGGAWVNDFALNWTSTATTGQGVFSKLAACQPGDTFYFSCFSQCGPGTGGYGVFTMYAAFFNSAGANSSNTALASTSTGGALSGQATAPAGSAYVAIMVLSGGASGVPYYFGIPVVRRMYTGTLIVNGSIVAANIAAGTITGNEINVSAALPPSVTVNGATLGNTQAQAAGATLNWYDAGSGTMTAYGDTVVKTSGFGWQGNMYSREFYVGGCSLSGNQQSYHTMMGLTLSRGYTGTNDFGHLAYAWYWDGGQWDVYESGAFISSHGGNLNNRAQIVYDGTAVRYYLDGVLKRTTTSGVTPNVLFYAGVAGYTVGAGYTGLSFTSYADNSLANADPAARINAYTTTISGGKITTGSITAAQIQANTITAGQIAAGAIGATQIATGAITASKMFIGAVDNLVLDANCNEVAYWQIINNVPSISRSGGNSASYGTDGAMYWSTNAGGGGGIYSRPATCRQGDAFYFSAYLGTGNNQTHLYAMCFNDAMVNNANYFLGANYNVYTAQFVSNTFIVPAGTNYIALLIYCPGAYNDAAMGQPVLRRMYTGSLIVDGSITANNLAANSVTAGSIAAGAINATSIIVDNIIVTDKLVANSVTNSVVSTAGAQLITNVGYTALNSLTITTYGGNVLMNFTDWLTWSSNGPRGVYQLVVDGGAVSQFGFGGGSCPDYIMLAGNTLATSLAAGSHTFSILAQWQAGSQPTSRNNVMVITELKK